MRLQLQPQRVEATHPSPFGERCLPRASVPVPLERVKPLHPSEQGVFARASRGSLHGRAMGLCSSECVCPTRASSGALHGRAEGLCTGEQRGFARAIRIEACEPFASRHASHSHGGMRAIRMEACEPFASRHASLSQAGIPSGRSFYLSNCELYCTLSRLNIYNTDIY